MPIAIGDTLPAVSFKVLGEAGPEDAPVADLFAGKTVALFAVPGAFTPTCHAKHLPSYVEHAAALKAKGVDMIACTSVNDPFVLKAWGETQNAGEITMLADPDAAFAKAIDLFFDGTAFGLGMRSMRYSMLVKDGVVTALNVESAPPVAEASLAPTLISQI